MPERTYTVYEIDWMRDSIERTLMGRGPYMEATRVVEVEERLRTYIAAGIEPADLDKEAAARMQLLENAPPGSIVVTTRFGALS